MTPLLLLAEKVEGLSGPDREVDAEIGLLVGGFFLAEPRYPGAIRMYGYVDSDGCRVEPGNGGSLSLIPRYTASLDAAMLLLDGVGVLLGLSDIGADGLPLARVGAPSLPDAPVFSGIGASIMVKTAPLAGLAIALCAAALRARAAMEAGDE